MNIEQIVTIGSLIIGLFGFLFGVYTHFSSRRVSKIVYEITQLTEFDLPDDFLAAVNEIPVMILIRSVGNKHADNIVMRLVSASEIISLEIESVEPLDIIDKSKNEVRARIGHLNPQESVKISLRCRKVDTLKNYLQKFEVTHSEGIGSDLKLMAARRQEAASTFAEALIRALLPKF